MEFFFVCVYRLHRWISILYFKNIVLYFSMLFHTVSLQSYIFSFSDVFFSSTSVASIAAHFCDFFLCFVFNVHYFSYLLRLVVAIS